MKKYGFLKGLAGLVLMTMFIVGCSKEEDPPEQFQSLAFDSEAVMDMVPDGLKNCDDDHAQECYSFIESAVDMSQFIDNMEVPDDAQRSLSKAASGAETWQWSWNYGGESFTFYWSYEETGGKRYWTMEIQYNNGPRYNYIDAWENMDGSGGEITYNYGWAGVLSSEPMEEEFLVYWTYSWSLDASGAYHLSFNWNSNEIEYDNYIVYEAVINANGSGNIDYYLMDELYYHMDWDVMGNGSWVYYINGEEYMSDIWTV